MKLLTRLIFLPVILTGFLFLTCCEKNKNSGLPTDGDGNEYDTVVIGTQVWMAENLKTTKYNNGVSIPLVTDNTQWASTTSAAFCWYDNDPGYKDSYGALYNWWAVKVFFLCPVGWHVPSKEEWTILIDYLGGEYMAGGKLKEYGFTNWLSPNEGASNETGFTALPGGRRYFGDGSYESIRYRGYWWTSSSTNDERFAWDVRMNNIGDDVVIGSFKKPTGYSVRCIKDN
jgi:uncharacterized protein (TIGR02145 family)